MLTFVKDDYSTAWSPQAGPQTAFVGCPLFEVFFGGARGGGKSWGVIGEWALHSSEHGAAAVGLMIRRTRIELLDLFEQARAVYTQVGATATYNPMRVTMPNGARLTFAYLERDPDAESYQGHSYTRVYIEEIGNFPSPVPVMKLMATLRSGSGVPVGMRLTGNPGGPGHQWVRSRYIDPAPMGWKKITDKATGLERIYIPSRVTDNQYLGADYVQRLKASGSPELVRAWLEGDWSVVSGAFFPEFSLERHVIAPRSLPQHWARFRSFDWGSARPFACHWWAVSDGSMHDIARGALVCYREWYGMKPGEPNVGLKQTAEAVAQGIKEREQDDPTPMIGVADPAMFAEDGGPSIAQRMIGQNVIFRPADNKRVPQRGAMGGWDQVRSRLVGDEDGRPMVLLFATCRDLIRTLPALQHDDARPEDVDSDMEDHAPDSCFVAGTLVETARGPVPIEEMRVGDMVATRAGMRPVSAVFSVGERDVFDVRLSNGATLTGTANHPIWVEGRGFVSLRNLRYGDMMRPLWSIQTNTDGSPAEYGASFTGRSPLATISTMSMATHRTTIHQTFSAFRRLSTGASIWRRVSQLFSCVRLAARHIAPSPSAYLAFAQMPARQRGDGHLASMTSSEHASAVAASSSSTDTAGKSTAHEYVPSPALMSALRRSIVVTTAALHLLQRMRAQSGAPTVVGEPTTAGRQRVFNLSVEEAEEYFANGVLAHNCRYACMSRPFVRDAEKPVVEDSWSRAFERAAREEQASGWRVA